MKTVTTTAPDDQDTSFIFSGGAGNRTGRSEIHIQARAIDERGRECLVVGWVDRDTLLDAIAEADSVTRRVVEPAL